MHRIDWVKERGGVTMDEYENNRFFKNAAIEYIRRNPRRFALLAVEKFRRFWNILPNHGPYRRPFYAAISVCSYLPVLLLAVVGLIWRRPRASVLLLLLAPVLYFTALHVIFVGSIRYRVAVMPFVILLQAANGVNFVLDGVLMGVLDTRFLMIQLFIAGPLIFFPLAALAYHFSWGLVGLWSALAAFFGSRFVMNAWRFRSRTYVGSLPRANIR